MADVEIDLSTTNPKELLGQGLRAYYVHDYNNAVTALGQATQLMAQQFGDDHDELGEVYVHYARALLGLSREESSPLGNAISNDDSDECSPDENMPEEADDKNTVEEDTADDNEKADAKLQDIEEAKEDAEESGPSGEAKETDEECTDLQLAWEVLEVAKKIFQHRGEKGKQMLAETLILLGEVGLENENFQEAIEDMKTGLELQKSLFDCTCRRLAETHYKIGTAQASFSNVEEALHHFEASLKVLKMRVDKLKKEIEDKSVENVESAKEEIEEINGLIPDVENKISDTKLMKEEAAQLLIEMAKTVKDKIAEVPTTQQTNSTTQTKSITNISHLVKRKHVAVTPTSTNDDDEAQPAKKATP